MGFGFYVSRNERLRRQHGLQGRMSTEQPAKQRADLLQCSCPVPGPRAISALREVPVIGRNLLSINESTMKEVLENYLNNELFKGDQLPVAVSGVEKRSSVDGDFYEIDFMTLPPKTHE